MSSTTTEQATRSTWLLRFRNVAAAALPWLAFAASNVACKLWIFHASSGSGSKGFWQSLAVVRWDLLVSGVALPLLLASLSAVLSARWRVRLNVTLALLLQFLLCVDVAIFRTLGTFVPLSTIFNLLHWLATTGDTHVLVAPAAVVVPLVVLFGMMIAASWWALRSGRNRQALVEVAAAAVVICFAIAGALACMPRSQYPEFTPPLLKIAAAKALGRPESGVAVIGKSLPELMDWYRLSERVPPPDKAFEAKARGYNVIFFVMESLPAEVLDPAGDLSDMPNLAALRPKAFVARQHYTTYPYTSFAVFSMLTSLYIQSSPGTLIESPAQQIPGMIRVLHESGYASGYYGFLWKNLYARDDRMIASLGFEKIADPTTNPNNDLAAKQMYVGAAQAVIEHDEQSLQLLRADIHAWTMEGKPFVTAYFPELGHDPWRAMDGRKDADPKAIGHALAVRHDAWLGELVQQLQSDGVLDKTILVVTSDHGERLEHATAGGQSRTISPDRLDERVMRVPLLIYAPGVVSATNWIDAATSHIDLQPTVLALLGVERGRNLEQGTEVWNAQIAHRRLFLATVAAEGFCSDDTCYSKPALGSVAKAQRLHFDTGAQLPSDGKELADVDHALSEHHALQHAILDLVLHTSTAE